MSGPEQSVRAPAMVDMRLVPGAVASWVGAFLATGPLSPATSGALAMVGLLCAVCCVWWWWRDPCRARAPGLHQRTPSGSWRWALAMVSALGGAALLTGSLAMSAYLADPVVGVAEQATSGQRGALTPPSSQEESPRYVNLRVVVQGDPRARTSPWDNPHAPSADSTMHMGAVDVRTLSVATKAGRASSDVVLYAQGTGWLRFQRGDVVDAVGVIDSSFRGEAPYAGTVIAQRPTLVAHPTGWLASVGRVRHALREVTGGLDPDTRGLILGMSVGDDALIDDTLREAMQTASLTHLTAVSGTHVAVLLTVIATVVPGRGLLRGGTALVAMVMLVAVVGPEPSVVRSCLMAVVGVWGMVSRRSGQAVAALCAVAIVMVLVDPWQARSFGFVLSALATWGVIAPASRVNQELRQLTEEWPARRLVRVVAEVFVISACAQVVVQPVMFILNPWIPTWGVLANVLVAPAVAGVCLAGLGAAATAWFWPGAAHLLVEVARPCAWWIAHVGRWCAELPGARMPWQVGVSIVMVGGIVASITWMLVRRYPRHVPHCHRQEAPWRQNAEQSQDQPRWPPLS